MSVQNDNELQVRNNFASQLSKELTTKRVFIVGGGILGLAIISPLVYIAIKTGLGIIAAGCLGLGGFFAWKRIPLWIMKYENNLTEANQREMNEHLERMKAEARKNPIAQLQNYLKLKAAQLAEYKKFVVEMGAQVKSFADMLLDRKKAKPDKDYSKKDAAVLAMQNAFNFHLEKSKAGDVALYNLKEAIDDANFDWKFSQVGQQTMQQMHNLEGEDILNDILADESFDSIRNDFNKVFSEIEVQIGTINSGKQLEFGEDISINLAQFHIPSMQELKNATESN